MISTYFKQAWQMMRQNKLFSSIYIGGTALAIAATTLYALFTYIKIAPIYPEYNRGQTVVFDRVQTSDKDNSVWQFNAGYDLVNELFYNLKDADVVTSIYNDRANEDYIKSRDGDTDIKVVVKRTDHNFFKVYEYEFLEGNPFSEIDFHDGLHTAVISAQTAEKAFGTSEGVVGKEIILNLKPHKVAGVVKDASSILGRSYGEVFVPYTTAQGYQNQGRKYLGGFRTTILTDNIESIRAQAKEFERRYNTSQDEFKLDLFNQPLTHLRWTLEPFPEKDFSFAKFLRSELLFLLILLLVPALNLSSLISSRMDMRAAEFGVRKSFGANKAALLIQILWENLLLTLVGAAVGLLIVWAMMYFSSGEVLTISNSFVDTSAAPASVNNDMMFSPGIFLLVFVICLILNMLSAFVPAWLNLRKPIVQSLKEK